MATPPIKYVARLHATLVAGGVAVTSVDANGIVDPANLQGAANPIIAAFDDSKPAQDSADNIEQRTKASDDIDNSRASVDKLHRAVADTIIDELNILRAIVVGVGSLVFDPPSLNNATGATSGNITVNGAAFGDFVDVAAPYNLQGITVTAYVSAANTVVIRLHNGTGAAVNLASGTWNVCVRRIASALPPRTLAQAKTVIKNKVNAGSVD